jgi:Trypsin-like peptidase domain
MKTNRSLLFLNNSIAMKWLKEIIDYISASYTNPVLWNRIHELGKSVASEKIKSIQKLALQQGVAVEALPIEIIMLPLDYHMPGVFFSIDFYLRLSQEMEKDKGGDDACGSVHLVGEAFELLLKSGVLEIPYEVYNRDAYRGKPPVQANQVYRAKQGVAEYLINNRLIYNHLFGFDYIVEKYSKSIVKIEVKVGEDTALGTGWIYDVINRDSIGNIMRLVVTNDHVLKGSKSIKVLDKDDAVIPHYGVELLLDRMGIDMAIIKIDYDNTIPALLVYDKVPLLEDIITIGYPSVPLSRAAYQVVHRGEVNAQVKDYFEQDLLIISARTAPGNSGSPVIDDTGRVVGMVTQQLFEKEAFEKKGIIPYSACIPGAVLIGALQNIQL